MDAFGNQIHIGCIAAFVTTYRVGSSGYRKFSVGKGQVVRLTPKKAVIREGDGKAMPHDWAEQAGTFHDTLYPITEE